MKKIISLILIFAMFSSLVLPVFAEDSYGADISFGKTEYSSSERISGSITVYKNGLAIKGLNPAYKIYSGNIEKYASDGRSNQKGSFTFDTPLSNFNMGAARIEVYFDGKVLATKSFLVKDTSTSSVHISNGEKVVGDSIVLTGTFYSNGKRAVNEDLVYKILNETKEIRANTVRTDKNGQINVEIQTIASHYTSGNYKVVVSHNGKTYSADFSLTDKEVILNSIRVNNKISTLEMNSTHTFNSSAVYSDNKSEIVTPVISSSNPGVVLVSNQKITAVSIGTAVITAKYKGLTDQFTLTVPEEKVLTITTDRSSYSLHDTMTITVLKPDSKSMDVVLKVYNGSRLISSMAGKLDKSGVMTWDFNIKEIYSAGIYRLQVILNKTSQSLYVTVADYGYDAIINVSDHVVGQKLWVTGTLKDANGKLLIKSDAILKLKKDNLLLATSSVKSDINGLFSNNDMILNYGVGRYTLELYGGTLLASKSFEVTSATLKSIAFESVQSSLRIPETLTLKVLALYGDGSKVDITHQNELTLSTSDANMALIKNNVLHPNKYGSLIITASYKGYTATHSVTIQAKNQPGQGTSGGSPGSAPTGGANPSSVPSLVAVSKVKIELDKNEVELEYGSQSDPAFLAYDLTETITGSDDKNVTWKVADGDLASVSQDGVVKALKSGETTVTVSHNGSGVFTTAKIVVFLVGEEQTPLGAIEFFEPYVQGYADGSFGPLRPVTRAEVATMFTKILKIDVKNPDQAKFTDVVEGKWYFSYVQAIEKTGLFVGDGDGTFRPNDPISRGELATVFVKYWRYLNIEVNKKPAYIPDVSGDHWASEYIFTIYNAGIKTSFVDGTYKPDAPALREQVVVMINTLIARPSKVSEVSMFSDVTVKHWAYGAIEAASQVYIKEEVKDTK